MKHFFQKLIISTPFLCTIAAIIWHYWKEKDKDYENIHLFENWSYEDKN